MLALESHLLGVGEGEEVWLGLEGGIGSVLGLRMERTSSPSSNRNVSSCLFDYGVWRGEWDLWCMLPD